MYKCNKCNKEFDSYRGLNGHNRVHGESNGTYTSRPKTATIHKFNCLCCGIEKEYHPKSSYGKYCSSECQIKYLWETVGKPKVMAGSGGNIRKYLTEEFGYKCSCCGLSDWLGQSITLQIDHIDGDSDNNKVSNLRFLCPNCHSQTETFSGRNVKNTKRNSYLRDYKKDKTQVRKAW